MLLVRTKNHVITQTAVGVADCRGESVVVKKLKNTHTTKITMSTTWDEKSSDGLLEFLDARYSVIAVAKP
jgi:hypothetical protein